MAARSATRPSSLLEITDKASALAFDTAAELILLWHETRKPEDEDADDNRWHERSCAPQPAGTTRTSQSLEDVFDEIYRNDSKLDVIVVKTPDE